jgi:hypothetical protein
VLKPYAAVIGWLPVVGLACGEAWIGSEYVGTRVQAAAVGT